jgi:hypothetical protein
MIIIKCILPKSFHLLLIIFLIYSKTAFSQEIFVPVNNDVYKYLSRMSVTGYIEIHDEIRPFSRLLIANTLKQLKMKENFLNEIDRSELNFYLKEYYNELNPILSLSNSDSVRINIANGGVNRRFRLLSYSDKIFNINIDPIIGYSFSSTNNIALIHRWNGLNLFGSLSNSLGFKLDFRDNIEKQDNITSFLNNEYDNSTGKILRGKSYNQIDYSEVNSTITTSWKWGNLSIGKDHHIVGSGENGQLILSTKSPSFPFIKLEISPVNWFSFLYIHGWLNSEVVDSTTIQKSLTNVSIASHTYLNREKYIAMHLFSIRPVKNLTFTLGESIVYSDRLQFIYLIPIMFYRLADHYLSYRTSGSNAQLFIDSNIKIPAIRTKLYSTLFIDEMSFGSFSDSHKSPTTIAYTFGSTIYDFIFQNTAINIEYTRLNPFTYMNFNPAQQYSNAGYTLGHWIGSNADQLYVSYTVKLSRGLSTNIWGQYIRKGQKENPDQQYSTPYPYFLFGRKKNLYSLGIETKYEIINDLTTKLNIEFNENYPQDTKIVNLNSNSKLISFAIYYGL